MTTADDAIRGAKRLTELLNGKCGEVAVTTMTRCVRDDGHEGKHGYPLPQSGGDLDVEWYEWENDMVNHPRHYAGTVPGIEAIEVARHFNFNRGNAIKYIWRAGAKDKAKEIEDLKKAVWYLTDEITQLEGERP